MRKKTKVKPWSIDGVPISAKGLIKKAFESGYMSKSNSCSVQVASFFLMEEGHFVCYAKEGW